MTPLLESAASVVRTTNMVLLKSLEDLAEPYTTTRVRNGQGPSLAWEVGHLLDFRCRLIQLLGVARENPYSDLFPASGPANAAAPRMADLQRDFQQIASELETAMSAVTETALRRAVDGEGHGEKTLLDSIAFLVWHEAYHVGAIGSIRKVLGYAGPAELFRSEAAAGAV